MSNNQATIEDLIDEMYDVLDKGWKMPLSNGKVLVDSEEIRAILDDIRDVFPQEIGQAKAIVSDHGQIIAEAKREADTIIKSAEDHAKSLVSQQEEIPGDINIFPLYYKGQPLTQRLSLIRMKDRYLSHYSKFFLEQLFQYFDAVERVHMERMAERSTD